MKLLRRRCHAGLTMAAAALAITACSAGSQTGSSVAQVVPCDFAAPSTPVTVNVLAYNSSAIDPFTDTMVKSCSKKNVTVRHDPIDFGGQYTKTPVTLAAPHGTYDLIEFYSAIVPTFAAKGQLRPLDELFAKYKDKYDLGGIDPLMLKGMTYKGKLYGLPMQANIGLMAYRKDIFAKLGIAVPTTYAELKAAAAKIQKVGDIQIPAGHAGQRPEHRVRAGDVITGHVLRRHRHEQAHVRHTPGEQGAAGARRPPTVHGSSGVDLRPAEGAAAALQRQGRDRHHVLRPDG